MFDCDWLRKLRCSCCGPSRSARWSPWTARNNEVSVPFMSQSVTLQLGGANTIEVPLDALVGALVRVRLLRVPNHDESPGATVGDYGGVWEETIVQPRGECISIDEWDPAPNPTLSGDYGHGAICPDCFADWTTDWQMEVILSVPGSGDSPT